MSDSKTRSLRLASYEEFQEIKDYLKNYLPLSLPMFQLLSAELSFALNKVFCPKRIYISNGENKFEFIFVTGVVTSTMFQNFEAFWNMETLNKYEVLQYLLSVPNFSWDKGFTMICQNKELANVISELVKERSLTAGELKVTLNDFGRFCNIPDDDEIAEPMLPKGYYFGELRPHHVPFVFKNWPYSNGESMMEYEILFELLPSCAIYKNNDDEFQDPVSFAFMYPYGFIGQTFTVLEHRRKGLASAATLQLSKMARTKFNLKAVVAIEHSNKLSFDMHKNIGFKIQNFVSWKKYEKL